MNEEIFNWKYPIQEIDDEEYSLLQFIYSPLIKYFAQSGKNQNSNPLRTILVNTKTGELFHSDAYDYIGTWKGKMVLTMDIDPETFQKTFQLNEFK